MAVLIREYPDSEHNPPPNGINDCTNFQWIFAEFYQAIRGRDAKSTTTQTTEATSTPFLCDSPCTMMFIVFFALSFAFNIVFVIASGSVHLLWVL